MNLNTMTERYQVHLCEDCFFRTLAYFKQKRGVQNLFSEECDTEMKAGERGMIATTSHHACFGRERSSKIAGTHRRTALPDSVLAG